jgi:hypothetical protein
MTTISELRDYANTSLEGEVRDLCLQVIGAVEERSNDRLSGLRWTFQNIAQWVGRSASDSQLQKAVLLLSSTADRSLFDMHFFYFSSFDEDDVGEPIDDAEVREAYASGYLIEPRSGKQIRDFERHLAPYFVPSERLRA